MNSGEQAALYFATLATKWSLARKHISKLFAVDWNKPLLKEAYMRNMEIILPVFFQGK